MSLVQLTAGRLARAWPAAGVSAIVAVILGMPPFDAAVGRAAELRLRTECRSDGTMITLGDVAEIFAADHHQADALATIELFTPPTAERQRFVRLREIQDLLLLRGVNLAEHRFSGSSQVEILGVGRPVQTELQQPLSLSTVKTANRRVSEAVEQYLQKNVSADQSWVVNVELNPDQMRLVSKSAGAVSIAGGAPPWTGLQRFELTVDTPGGSVRLPLDAQVSLPPAMVVSVRPLLRGTLLRAADVELKRVSSQDARGGGFHSIDEVVGKETIQAIPKGKVLQTRMIRPPLLVRRGDVVTVRARCSGIVVRTTARARDDGALGELISVESLLDREKYYARVSRIREVKVFAHPIQASPVFINGVAIGRQSPAAWR